MGGLRPQCHMGGAVALLSARSALSALQRAFQCLWGAGQGGRGRPRRWSAGRVVRPAAQFFALNWVQCWLQSLGFTHICISAGEVASCSMKSDCGEHLR